MDYADIIARIAAAINDDEVAAITGPVGNGILNDMVAEIGEGYQFAGILTPTSNPVRTDARLWALAMAPGKYYNLDGRVLADGQVAVFMWGGGWSSVVLSVTTAEAVRELLSQFMDAATADAEVDLKADELTPVVPPMVTGSARGILGRSAAARFLYRQTSSGSGAAWLRSIHGRTVSYNQLVRNGDFSGNISGWVAYYSENVSVAYGNHSIIATMISSIGGYAAGIRTSILPTMPIGHKALIEYEVKCSVNCAFGAEIGNMNIVAISATANQWTKISGITAGVSRLGNPLILKPQTVLSIDDTYEIRNVIVTDLTQAGLDSVITTPAEFEAWQMEQFGHKGYLGYTPGKLVSVNPTGVLTTGRNQWDEEWESGSISIITGENEIDPSIIRNKNYIRVFGGETYFIKIGDKTLQLFQYDENKNFLTGWNSGNNYKGFATSAEWSLLPTCSYIRIRILNSTTYNHDICINISDPAFNGQYVPYNGHTMPLDFTEHFPTGMNGVNGIYDEAVSDENGKFTDGEKRFGIVDLGTLEWDFSSQFNCFICRSNLPGAKIAYKAILAKYPFIGSYSSPQREDKTAFYIFNQRIAVEDSAYTSAADFKAAVTGVPLVFELATPQHITFTDPSDAVYPVTEGGTEQVLPVNGSEPTTIAPDFQIEAPLRRGYDTPTDATFDNFLEALGQHLGKTIAKEWDAETQTYQFDIL